MTDLQGPIRVAFLGVDETTPNLLRAVLADARFELAGICEFDDGTAEVPEELRPVVERTRQIGEWEALLDDQQIDAVIVSRGPNEDVRTEQLRKLIQVEKPALVSHPVVHSMLVYYELDMIRRETDSLVIPHLAERKHPAVQTLGEIVRQGSDSPIGKVEHLTIERCVREPTRQNVERQFARDVDVVRAIAGDMTRLGAMGGAHDDAGYASLGVQMSGPLGVAARWSVVPIASDEGAKITITGARGRAIVELREDGTPWTLACIAGGEPETQSFDGWDAAETSLDELVAAMSERPPEPDWVDASRSVELAETIDRSLKKSRTVELYYEDYTEDATFKGTMTSLGCGLLVLSVFLLALVGIAEQMKIPYVGYWRYLLVGLLVVFLLMQLVMFTSGKKKHDSESPSSDA